MELPRLPTRNLSIGTQKGLIRSLGAAGGSSRCPKAHSINLSEFMLSVSKRLLPLVPADLVVNQVLPTPNCLTILYQSRIAAPLCPGCSRCRCAGCAVGGLTARNIFSPSAWPLLPGCVLSGRHAWAACNTGLAPEKWRILCSVHIGLGL